MELILVFQAASQKSAVFFFTGVYKNFTKVFREPLDGCFRIVIFFLQVSELNKKLDELSLKGWIYPCKEQPLYPLGEKEDNPTDHVLQYERGEEGKQKNIKPNTEEEREEVVPIYRNKTKGREKKKRAFRKKEKNQEDQTVRLRVTKNTHIKVHREISNKR